MSSLNMYDYILFASAFKLTPKAILQDLKNHGFDFMTLHRVSKIAEHYLIDKTSVDSYVTSDYTGKNTNARFVIELRRNGNMSSESIYRRAKARGFTWITDATMVDHILTRHSTLKANLIVGPSHKQWEDAVWGCFQLGYSPHEINHYSIGRGHCELLECIHDIIAYKIDKPVWMNTEWKTDREAHRYVVHAYALGLSVQDITEQVHIHRGHLFLITERLIERFLIEVGCMKSNKRPEGQITTPVKPRKAGWMEETASEAPHVLMKPMDYFNSLSTSRFG